MLHGYIDIPTYNFFKEKNIWTGSLFQKFNYRIMPISTEEKKELYCVIWYGDLCYDLTEEFVSELHEDLSDEGLKNLIEKINQAAEEYKHTH